jgi:hypothetical protein
MKRIAVPLALVVCAVLAGMIAVAEERPAANAAGKAVTLEGTVVCAKCAIHEEGRTECQNVLMVGKEGAQTSYYLVKNDAYNKFGEVCEASKKVRVTGTVEAKDGKQWLTASDIKSADAKG